MYNKWFVRNTLSRSYYKPEPAGSPTEPKKFKTPILYVSAYTCTKLIVRPEQELLAIRTTICYVQVFIVFIYFINY